MFGLDTTDYPACDHAALNAVKLGDSLYIERITIFAPCIGDKTKIVWKNHPSGNIFDSLKKLDWGSS